MKTLTKNNRNERPSFEVAFDTLNERRWASQSAERSFFILGKTLLCRSGYNSEKNAASHCPEVFRFIAVIATKRLAGRVARIRNSFKISSEKHLERYRRKWEDSIEMDLN